MSAEPPRSGARPGAGRPVAALPVAVLALALLGTIGSDGAFAHRYWGALGVFALTLLASYAAAAAVVVRGRAEKLAVSAVWGFAAWSFASSLWAASAAQALEGGGRAALYAAIVTIVLGSAGPERVLRVLATGIVAALALVAVSELVAVFADGAGQYLAGRLDEPLSYRNASAALFAMPFWGLLVAASGNTPPAALRGLALGASVCALGLAVMTQSRGVVLGLVAGGAVAMALVPSRLRLAGAAAVAVAAVAVCHDALLRPWRAFDGGAGTVLASDVHAAARALTVAALCAVAVGALLAALDRRIARSPSRRRAARRAGVAVAVVAGLAAAGAAGDRIGWDPGRFVGDRVEEFRAGSPADPSESRLTSLGGQRSDIWRIALRGFRAEPLHGAGSENFRFRYFAERRTDRNLTNAHSLPLAVLSETGAIGALLLGCLVGALAWAIGSRARSASPQARRLAAGLAAGGVAVLAQDAVDWLWLIPGVTGLALLMVALAARLLRPPSQGTEPASGGGVVRVATAAVALAACVATLLPFLSDLYVRRARAAADGPARALEEARAAERLNPLSVRPDFLQAGALESLGRRDAAREELREALGREPENFVVWGLLGDLEVRAGRYAAARAAYRRALALNPRDAGLRELSRVTRASAVSD